MDWAVRIREIAAESGFQASGYVEIRKLSYHEEVRRICEGNTCRNYGASWACPPAVGTLEECRNQVNQYDRMLLISRAYPLEDSFDFEGMTAAGRDFKQQVDLFHRRLQGTLPAFLLLSNEGCGRCTKCTYPDAPCRFPEMLHPSLEGYGFIVSELAKEAGVRYHNGPNTVTYFGALLFQET